MDFWTEHHFNLIWADWEKKTTGKWLAQLHWSFPKMGTIVVQYGGTGTGSQRTGMYCKDFIALCQKRFITHSRRLSSCKSEKGSTPWYKDKTLKAKIAQNKRQLYLGDHPCKVITILFVCLFVCNLILIRFFTSSYTYIYLHIYTYN